MVTNIMNPDQTAPRGAVWPGSILFATYTSKVCEQVSEQTTTVKNGGERVKLLNWYWLILIYPLCINRFFPLVRYNKLGRVHCRYRAVTCLTLHVSLTIIFLVVNSVDPNDMLHYAAFKISV